MKKKYYDPKLEVIFNLFRDNKPFDMSEMLTLCKIAQPIVAYAYLREAFLYIDHPQYIEFLSVLRKINN